MKLSVLFLLKMTSYGETIFCCYCWLLKRIFRYYRLCWLLFNSLSHLLLRLHRGARGPPIQAWRHPLPDRLQHGDPLLLDEGGQHGRRDPFLHQVLRTQERRVLLPDMVRLGFKPLKMPGANTGCFTRIAITFFHAVIYENSQRGERKINSYMHKVIKV